MYNPPGRYLSYFVRIQNIEDMLCRAVGKKIIPKKRETKERRNTREVAIRGAAVRRAIEEARA
jgi:hypothetical protein